MEFWRNDIDPGHEPHKVMIHKDVFVDTNRDNREIPYKIYYPVNHNMTDLPVIVWSHGLGGGRDGASFLARYISSHGYVVIHPQHLGTDTSIWEGKPGHPWDVIRNTEITRETTINRFLDVPFLLDCLPQFVKNYPEIGVHMDLDTIGICGHSFGALTTQVMAGQMFPDDQGKLNSFKEDRFKAGILYSFVPMDHLTDAEPKQIFAQMDIPLFFMTGTNDDSPISGRDYTYRMPVFENAPHDENILMVLKGGDHMVFTGSRGKLESYPDRKEHEAVIKITSLAYWDYHLRGDEAAENWLYGKNGLTRYLSAHELQYGSNNQNKESNHG